MTRELRLIPAAAEDIRCSAEWYESRRDGLGDEFITCVEACFDGIVRMPEMHEIIEQDIRRALVRRFPYVVFYVITNHQITVYAVLHSARDSDKWKNRIEF